MTNAIKRFPWFEVLLILGLAAALIMKPQTKALSAPPDAKPSGGVTSVLPLSSVLPGSL